MANTKMAKKIGIPADPVDDQDAEERGESSLPNDANIDACEDVDGQLIKDVVHDVYDTHNDELDETMEDIEGGTYIPFADDATTTRPDAPYVGFVFDTIEEAQMVYNSYAKKLGFGTRICYTKRTQKKGCNHIIRREFKCVHAGRESTQDGGKQAVCDPEWYKIEEQASKFYTRTAFGKFKEMMEETTALMINPVEGGLPDPDPPARVDVEVVGSRNVKNPPKSAKKGRPKDKEKRRKPLVELRQEKAQQKAKKKGVCSYCKEDWHDKRNCPYLALERQRQKVEAEKLRRS
ncbi:hypothetical protein D1007_13685 [Hordeum vulgare]|nr:hypothetical protein D1007_13685 [Hordeum vulgare]